MSEVSKNTRFYLLDAARGVAAIAIMSFHLYLYSLGRFWSGINTFVDFFFVLSGFVLAPQIILLGAREFLLKRILRLYPILIPVFVVILFSERISGNSTILGQVPPTGVQYLGAFLLLQVLWGSVIFINIPLWSLSAEWFINIFSIFFKFKVRLMFVIAAGLLIEFWGCF